MCRFVVKLLIVLAVMDAAFNAVWAAYARTPTSPLYTALALAFGLALLLGRLEQKALAYPARRMP